MNKIKKSIIYVIILTLCVHHTAPFVSAAQFSQVAQQAETDGTDQTLSVNNTDALKVTFTLDGQWNGGYQATIKMKNISNQTIHNWYLSFAYEETISNIWNGEIVHYQDGSYVIKNAGWNQDIQAGESISFGFLASGEFFRCPEKYELVSKKIKWSKEDVTPVYHIDNDWGTGFHGTISVTNHTDTVIEDWILAFDFDRTITNLWGAVIESHQGRHYVFSNVGYNSNIAPGQTLSFGFAGIDGNLSDEPEIYQIYSYNLDTRETASECIVTFDGGGDDAIVPKEQRVEMGTLAEKPEDPIREGFFFIGWYTEEDYQNYFDFESTVIYHNMTLYARWINLFSDVDTDGDGIGDSLEEYIGTDSTRTDTDGDGLSDEIEIMKSETDPLVIDTDGNGISDGDEDLDQDGLCNQLEEQYQTDLTKKDTDEDDLDDFAEIYVFGTDPVLEDTDGDSLSDGDEIKLGFNPIEKDTDKNGVLDCDEIKEQKLEVRIKNTKKKGIESVGVNLSCSGLIDRHVEIKDSSSTDIMSANVVGIVGVPVTIESDVSFDEAVITFYYDESQLGETKEKDLCMMWYDEENDTYVLLEDSYIDAQNNTVSYKTTHFSTYLVVDKKSWMNVLKENASDNFDILQWLKEKLQGEKQVSSVYKCFEDGMTWDEANAKCNEMGGHLVTITSADEQAIVESLIRSEGSKNNYWIGAQKSTGSASYQWVTEEKMSYTRFKGGYPDNHYGQEDALMIYRNNNPMLSGDCFGYWNDLNRNGTCMGENFFGIENMGFICEWDDVDVEDRDHDGVMDILEESYMLSNGQIVSSDPEKTDTDGDGLSDGEEIGEPEITTVTTVENEYVILVWHAKSDPSKKDSDDDGLYDSGNRKINGVVVAPPDPDPTNSNGPKGMWNTHVMQQDIGVVSRKYDQKDMTLKVDDWIESMSDAMKKGAEEENIYMPDAEEVATVIVKSILTLRDDVSNNQDDIHDFAVCLRFIVKKLPLAEIGSLILNFVRDEDHVAYHSQPETWQRYFGYNQFYDEIFDIGSHMNKMPVYFTVGTDKYALWMWKGDYWNLRSGAEIGLYIYSDKYSEVRHYNAIDFQVPMTLSLYNYYDEDDIDNIFSWSPEEEQWWITGFSGTNKKFMEPDPNIMVAVGSVDLSGHQEMYNALKKAEKDQNEYLLFDDEEKTVWIMWYEGADNDEEK